MNDLEQHADILSLIRVRMSELSKGHKRIAEYILANYEKCAFLTAAKLGEVVGVSESTAVRFPAALGFSGYPEFQKALEDILQEKIHSFDRIDVLNSHMTTNMVVNNVMSMDARKIENTLKSFDTASFDMAVEDIMAAESVYIIGARSCEPLAEFFGYYLRLVKKNVQVVKTGNTNELFEQMKINKEHILQMIHILNVLFKENVCSELQIEKVVAYLHETYLYCYTDRFFAEEKHTENLMLMTFGTNKQYVSYRDILKSIRKMPKVEMINKFLKLGRRIHCKRIDDVVVRGIYCHRKKQFLKLEI